jgi:hypothetical protein
VWKEVLFHTKQTTTKNEKKSNESNTRRRRRRRRRRRTKLLSLCFPEKKSVKSGAAATPSFFFSLFKHAFWSLSLLSRRLQRVRAPDKKAEEREREGV